MSDDADQVKAAREGLGKDADLLVDAGTVWESDVAPAKERLEALRECEVRWLEEPFVSEAFDAYRELAKHSGEVGLAGGEGCHQALQAINMMNHASLRYIQIDTGRIGGITSAVQVADHANAKDITFVNHTFTTHLALSASLQPAAALEKHDLCEYPVEASALAKSLTVERLLPDEDGLIHLPEKPGLGLTPDLESVRQYLVETEIVVAGVTIYETPSLG